MQTNTSGAQNINNSSKMTCAKVIYVPNHFYEPSQTDNATFKITDRGQLTAARDENLHLSGPDKKFEMRSFLKGKVKTNFIQKYFILTIQYTEKKVPPKMKKR